MQCSRTVESDAKKTCCHLGERLPRPLSQIPRVLFSLDLLYFRCDVPTIRQRIFSETPPETNVSVNFCLVLLHVDGRKANFFENDDVLASDFAPDKKSLLPPCLAIFSVF